MGERERKVGIVGEDWMMGKGDYNDGKGKNEEIF